MEVIFSKKCYSQIPICIKSTCVSQRIFLMHMAISDQSCEVGSSLSTYPSQIIYIFTLSGVLKFALAAAVKLKLQ